MWNQYLLPVVLMTDSKRYLLTQGLAFMLHQQYYKNDWSGLFAAVISLIGMANRKQEPLPYSLSAQMHPPIISTIFLEMARPRPVPVVFYLKGPSIRVN
jgi:hypothetical protein